MARMGDAKTAMAILIEEARGQRTALATIVPLAELLLVLVHAGAHLVGTFGDFGPFFEDWAYAIRRAGEAAKDIKGNDLPFVSEWDRTEFVELLADYLTP